MGISEADWDVVVIGGGPAGSSTAALLALNGRRVLLAEKNAFPRFHTGESMLPGSWSVFWKLGIAEKMERCAQQKKIGARFNLFGQREYLFGLARPVLEYLPDNRGKFHAWNVVRSSFDQMLLDHAREVGATILQPRAVDEVLFEGSQAVGAVLIDEKGDRTIARAKVVVDATGRDCLIARKLGLRHPDPKLNKISYFAHYEDAYHPPEEFVPIWIGTFDGGWVWYFPMMDNLTSVGVVVDAEYAKRRQGRDLDAFFKETLAKVPYVTDWMANAKPTTELHAISALSYMNDRFAGDGWLLAGDAAGFIDPIFSAGILLALKSGELGSAVIEKAFARNDFSGAALADYETGLREQMSAIFPMIYRWYDVLDDPRKAITLFEQATRFSWLRRKMNAALVGAWEAVARDPSFKFEAMMDPAMREQIQARQRENSWGVSITPVEGSTLSAPMPTMS